MVFPSSCQQALVTMTPSWESSRGDLYLLEKIKDSDWKVSIKASCILGKNGLRWGRGLHPLRDLEGAHKVEGDMASPAGIFSLGACFGKKPLQIAMPYQILEKEHIWVDDPSSSHYNRLMLASSCHSTISRENMYAEELYELGFVIEHNTHPIEQGRGSAIFCHLATEDTSYTAGCLALKEKELYRIIKTLVPEKDPHLIQLPLEEYKKKELLWGLPLFLWNSSNQD